MLNMIKRWLDDAHIGAHDRRTLKSVEEHGWTANYVFEERDIAHKDFAYTIGFSDFGAPELIVFELDPQLINGVLWQYFLYLKSGEKLVDGLIFRPSDMNGFECMLRQAVKAETWTGHVFDSIRYSRTKGRGDKPCVMQVVWPSPETGHYPWSAGCPESMIARQPALYDGAPLAVGPVFDAIA